MNKKKAIEKLLCSSNAIKKRFERLLEWDETETLRVNSKFFGESIPLARNFAKVNKLGFLGRKKLSVSLIKTLLNSGYTKPEISKMFNLKPNTVYQILYRGEK